MTKPKDLFPRNNSASPYVENKSSEIVNSNLPTPLMASPYNQKLRLAPKVKKLNPLYQTQRIVEPNYMYMSGNLPVSTRGGTQIQQAWAPVYPQQPYTPQNIPPIMMPSQKPFQESVIRPFY